MPIGVDPLMQGYQYSINQQTRGTKDKTTSSSNVNSEEYANSLFAKEREYRVQYSKTVADSNVESVDDLKKEINKLFPEFTFCNSNPSDVVKGENLLYIDDANMQKMIDDPSYRAEVYALMKRELAGNNGFSVFGHTYKTTGFVFSLCNENSNIGGIPYSGMSTCIRLDNKPIASRNNKDKDEDVISKTQRIAKEKRLHRNAVNKYEKNICYR